MLILENPKKKINEYSVPKDFTNFMEKMMKFAEEKSKDIEDIIKRIKKTNSKQSMENQLNLIAWYDEKKGYRKLKEVIDENKDLNLFSLSKEKKAEIAIMRINETKDYKRNSLRYGSIDQERALKEIGFRKNGKRKKPTKLGMELIDLECREISLAYEKAKNNIGDN